MRKKSSAGFVAALILIIAAVILIIITAMLITGKGVGSNPVTMGISREVTKKAVSEFVSDAAGYDVDIDAIQEQMSDEDAAEVDRIIDKYAQSGLLSEAISTWRDNGGDLSAVYDALSDSVDDEDVATLQELYERYQGQF